MSDDKFLHDLLTTMIKQHGVEVVAAQLAQLHAKMSVSSAKIPKQDIECNRCGGSISGIGHYCM